MAADTNLQNLHDIVVPPPVPAWPPAPGWYVVAGVVLLVLALFAAWIWRRYRRRAYRRAALAELRRIDTPDSQSIMAITEILKRTALVAYPRSEVAALSGEDWWAFLDAHCSASQFGEQLGALADACRYQNHEAAKTDVDALRQATERWIEKHRAAATPDAA